MWRSELTIAEGVVIPFNFEARYNESEELEIIIHNDSERILISDVSFGNNQQGKDTFYLDFQLLDSHIEAEYKENVLEGEWIRHNRENYRIPWVAYHGQSHRFSTGRTEVQTDLTGRWEARFEIETETEYPAIGEFVQEGNRVSGTFMTETGDYRYLEGEIQGDRFQLSTFDGAHAFLFTGEIDESDRILGKFYSGNHYETNWTAFRNEEASLTSAYELSGIKNPGEPLQFELPNSEGNIVTLEDSRYVDKPKLISIMGTWCPNCLDESKFILEYLENNPELDIEVIAIAYERYRDKDKVLETLSRYKEKLQIPYEILHGGYYNKEEATNTFGFLDKIISYPTLLFVDRNNRVTKVHTGYTGPATSKFVEFSKEFDEEVRNITAP